MRQYRIINFSTDSFSDVLDYPTASARWEQLFTVAEERGWRCLLEYRDVFEIAEADDLALFSDESGKLLKGYMLLGSRLITNWRYDAACNIERADICNRY